MTKDLTRSEFFSPKIMYLKKYLADPTQWDRCLREIECTILSVRHREECFSFFMLSTEARDIISAIRRDLTALLEKEPQAARRLWNVWPEGVKFDPKDPLAIHKRLVDDCHLALKWPTRREFNKSQRQYLRSLLEKIRAKYLCKSREGSGPADDFAQLLADVGEICFEEAISKDTARKWTEYDGSIPLGTIEITTSIFSPDVFH